MMPASALADLRDCHAALAHMIAWAERREWAQTGALVRATVDLATRIERLANDLQPVEKRRCERPYLRRVS